MPAMIKLASMLALGSACASVWVVSASEFVQNGGFGEGVKWWSIPPSGLYKFENNGGYNGSQGLVFINTDVKKTAPGYPGQALKLKPGQQYKFTGRVRAKKSSAEGAEFKVFMLIDVKGADGKWMCEYWSETVSDTSNDWIRVNGKTSPLPPEGVTFSVRPIAVGAGEAAFDELSVEQLETDPVQAIASSVYRDTAWTGKVRFDAHLAIDTGRTPISAFKASFSFPDDKGATVKVPAESFDELGAAITIDVAELPMGAYPVSFELRDLTNALIGSKTLTFTRTAERPARKVWIDEHNRCVIAGKPFFPLGFYHSNITPEILDIYCKGPFNCVLPYMSISREQFDNCHKRGIKVIPCLTTFHPGAKYCPINGIETQEDADRAVIARVNALKDHPATLAWYLTDEAPVSELPQLIARNKLIKEIDPDHPTYSVYCQIDQVRNYRLTCDVLGTDIYPIAAKPVGLASVFARTTQKGAGGGPIWQVPQAFAWKWFGRTGENSRMPTKAESRSMAWQCVANGANGVIFYCFHHMIDDQPRADFNRDWEDYCAIAAEISPFIPVFLADPAQNATGYEDGKTSGRAWIKDGETHLLVVNETREPVKTGLNLSDKYASINPSLDKVEPVLDGDRLSFELPGLGVAMFKLVK